MRLRSYLALGALALAPMLALAGEASAQMDAQHAAQPMFVNVNGQAVPVKAETHVVQTAMGPMKVSTWSWHSPGGSASYEMQTSTGGAPSAVALRQMQMAQAQMVAMQQQMMAMQQQMVVLQHSAFAGGFAVPAPQNVVFAVPLWAMPDPVVIVEPVQRAPAPAVAPPTAPTRSPGIKA
ncbi:hypothetical protein LMG28688_02202 [Paraburkholderia caffeinitolerans]|uniref:Uncharacterized protein n=1 Tax=Paraburkholderia caffeinitolerans TaxID=1723730 RepID=A0A6J5FRV9_9BURK|nr:hypothetical protein [Paraburkholderia caffeinitolerans]CAB3786071.1 hypothetical protein LMG28688_02202 [Paraburkholderia caffeinitolerans]